MFKNKTSDIRTITPEFIQMFLSLRPEKKHLQHSMIMLFAIHNRFSRIAIHLQTRTTNPLLNINAINHCEALDSACANTNTHHPCYMEPLMVYFSFVGFVTKPFYLYTESRLQVLRVNLTTSYYLHHFFHEPITKLFIATIETTTPVTDQLT